MAKQKETPDNQETGKQETIKKEAKKKEAAPPAAVAEAPAAAPKPATKSTKVGKLLPKNKSRLPRREKKAQKKAAGRL